MTSDILIRPRRRGERLEDAKFRTFGHWELLGKGPGGLVVSESAHFAVAWAGSRAREDLGDMLAAAEAGGADLLTVGESDHGVLALFDKRSGAWTIKRDQGGFQPFFYSQTRDGVAGSTSVRWLVAHGGLDGDAISLSPRGIGLYVSFQYLPPPATIYAGVAQMAPGETLIWDHSRVRRLRAAARWDQDMRITTGPSTHEVTASMVQIIHSSAKQWLEADASVGVFVSGGMDTSAVVDALVNGADQRPVAFTATFEDPEFDEWGYAHLVAEHYGLEHVRVQITSEMLTDLPHIVAGFEMPHGDRAALAEYQLAVVARERGVQQMFTGEGGDEILGYPRARDGERLFAALPADSDQLASHYLEATALARGNQRTTMLQGLGLEPDLGESFLREVHDSHSDSDPFERLYYGQWATWLVGGVYVKDRAVLASAGIEAAFPLMNAKLMRLMSSLTLDQKRSGLWDKALLKSGLSAALPAATLNKPKQKFWLPFDDWFRQDTYAMVRDVLLDSSGMVSSFFSDSELETLLVEHRREAADHSRLLWGLMFLQEWCRQQ